MIKLALVGYVVATFVATYCWDLLLDIIWKE